MSESTGVAQTSDPPWELVQSEADAAQTTTEITELPPPERARVALKASQAEQQIREKISSTKLIQAVADKEGRELAHRALQDLVKMRTSLKELAKAVRDDANKFSKAVISEENRLVELITPEEQRLRDLRDDFDAEQERIKREREEAERRKKLEQAQRIADIKSYVSLAASARTSTKVGELIAKVSQLKADYEASGFDEAFGEFEVEARRVFDETIKGMQEVQASKIEEEEEQRRLAAQREQERRNNEAQLSQQREAAQREAKAREQAEREAAASREQAQRESAEANRVRMIMSEIQAIQHQVLIADGGRLGVREGGTIECVRETLEETRAWVIDDRFGEFQGMAQLTKDNVVRAIEAMLNDRLRAQAELEETRRREEEQMAQQRAQDQQAISEVVKTDDLMGKTVHVNDYFPPTDEATITPMETGITSIDADALDSGLADLLDSVSDETPQAPEAQQLVQAVADHFGVSLSVACDWIVIRFDEIEIMAVGS